MQIDNAKRAWKISLSPLRKILKDMVRSGKTLRSETRDVSRSFSELNEQVASQAGLGIRSVRSAVHKANPSTQEIYEAKTRMRCTQIIDQAIKRCQNWFAVKHASCMRTISVPFINHLLCIPMKFSFLCHFAKIMHTWCRDKIPVEGNFGQTYDRVNDSVDSLNQDFTASLAVKEEHQTMLVGANLSHRHLVDEVNEEVAKQGERLSTSMSVLRVLLSCMFIIVFASAFSYTNSYTQDIRFDNLYISRYFRQIDARRRKQKKRTLLPLRRAEQSSLIDPLRLAFQPPETKNMMSELLGCLPASLFVIIACVLDFLLYTIFSTIKHHSFVEYSFRSSHHLEVIVGGNTMMARLLRSTIGALNTSSEMVMETNNLQGEEAHSLPLQRDAPAEDGFHHRAAEAHHPARAAAQKTGEALPGQAGPLAPVPPAVSPQVLHPLRPAPIQQLQIVPRPRVRDPLLPDVLAGHGAGLLCLQPRGTPVLR
ncbi:E3 ubiquitin-protein ligase DCST1 isoform X2 [Podarcis muralis]